MTSKLRNGLTKMRKSLIQLNMALLASVLLLSGCGWFGGRSQSATLPTETGNALIPQERAGMFDRPQELDRAEPIAVVRELRIDANSGGAIVYAEGLASRQGAYGVRLRADDPDLTPKDGVLGFTFLVIYPQEPTPVGADRTRIVNAAFSLTNQELEGVTLIRVTGGQNALESRRR